MSNWRSMNTQDKYDFLFWADQSLKARWNLGDLRYNSSENGFQGNPLDHAIEEALDLLVYLWVQKRRESEVGV